MEYTQRATPLVIPKEDMSLLSPLNSLVLNDIYFTNATCLMLQWNIHEIPLMEWDLQDLLFEKYNVRFKISMEREANMGFYGRRQLVFGDSNQLQDIYNYLAKDVNIKHLCDFYAITTTLPQNDYDLLPLRYAIGAYRLPITYLTKNKVKLVYSYDPQFNEMYQFDIVPECVLGTQFDQHSLALYQYDLVDQEFMPYMQNDKHLSFEGRLSNGYLAVNYFELQAKYTKMLAMSRKINLNMVGFYDKRNLPNSQLDMTVFNAIPCLQATVKYSMLKRIDPLIETSLFYQQQKQAQYSYYNSSSNQASSNKKRRN